MSYSSTRHDKTQVERKVPLRVLHLSMSRTGSQSMKAAYERLGLPCYHGFTVMERSSDQIHWLDLIDRKYYGKSGPPITRDDFDAFLGEWAVLSDIHVLGFTDELLEAYPEAKVVLVDRDLDAWEQSYKEGVIANSYNPIVTVLENFIEPFKAARPATLTKKVIYKFFDCKDRESYEANLKRTYQRHYAHVRSVVPREKLLNYKLGSGWDPLCEFLEIPPEDVPKEKFPHKNEREEFRVWMRNVQMEQLRIGLSGVVKYVLPVTVLVTVAWWLRNGQS